MFWMDLWLIVNAKMIEVKGNEIMKKIETESMTVEGKMKWNEGINKPRDFEMDWKRNPSEITEFEWIKIKIWNEIQWKLKWKREDTKRSPMKAQVKWIRRAKWNPRYFCIIIEEIWPRKENYIEY